MNWNEIVVAIAYNFGWYHVSNSFEYFEKCLVRQIGANNQYIIDLINELSLITY